MITIDGSHGEGGGQIVRTALALSTMTGKPFTAINIRKGRDVPGLKPQHLTAAKTLQELCSAEVKGLHIGSETLVFIPKRLQPKNLTIDIGTAGSITLLLQSLLLPLIQTRQPTTLTIRGGTDVSWSMPIDFFSKVFCNYIKGFAQVNTTIQKRGFYPKGGGIVKLEIKPKNEKPLPFELLSHDELLGITGISYASNDLKTLEVAERQAEAAKKMLETFAGIEIAKQYCDTDSPGSGIVLQADYPKNKTIGADSLGKKGKTAENVGREAAQKLLQEIQSGAVVDSHTADSLIPFIALAGGAIQTSSITGHIISNIYVCEQFLEVKFEIEDNIIKVI